MWGANSLEEVRMTPKRLEKAQRIQDDLKTVSTLLAENTFMGLKGMVFFLLTGHVVLTRPFLKSKKQELLKEFKAL